MIILLTGSGYLYLKHHDTHEFERQVAKFMVRAFQKMALGVI